jgi:Uncharacterised protein family (UPF0175)
VGSFALHDSHSTSTPVDCRQITLVRVLAPIAAEPNPTRLDIPDDLVQQLAEEGKDLSRAALEALAIDAYRMNRITGFQLRTLLDIP